MDAQEKHETFHKILENIDLFAEHMSGIKLRSYQVEVARAVARSVWNKQGLTFVVIFPRQSGKNELQAQIETYIMTMLHAQDAELVKVSPTWKPQALNAMRRLERVLKRNAITATHWKREQGYIYQLNKTRIYFLSGSPSSNIVGQTANTLLECDEAQDVMMDKWDKDIAPMAASTNATRVFWGTAWTSQTLLAREKRAALAEEKADGIKRVFQIGADSVRQEVPRYGKFVDGEVAKHGRNNPFIKTQYYSEEIDETGGMFPPERIAMLRGEHPYQVDPQQGSLYVFCLDVAGSDENSDRKSATDVRDKTALTIFELIPPSVNSILPGDNFPTFNIVHRRSWSGTSQVSLYRQIYALIDLWRPHKLVIDATGVGEGLSSFLSKSYPNQVIPFKFSQSSKSDLGWRLLSAIETGRFKDFCKLEEFDNITRRNLGDIPTTDQTFLQEQFYKQLSLCTLELVPGPGKIIRWSVPEAARDSAGELVHDDLLLSAALVAALFDEKGLGAAQSAVIQAYDPLSEMKY